MNYLYLVLAGILSGGIVFGGKIMAMLGASPFEVMLGPNLIGAVLALPFSWKALSAVGGFPLRINLLFILSVFVIAVGQYLPLFMDISVTLVLLLLYIQPVWTILIERFYFKAEVPPLQWLMVVAMVFGLLFLINPFEDLHFSLTGIMLALAAGLGLSIWILVSQYFSRHNIPPLTTYFCTCFYAVLPLLAFYAADSEVFVLRPQPQWGDGRHWLWPALFVYSVLIYTPANTLVFVGNRNVSPTVVGMILLLEPVIGIVLDTAVLHTPLSWNIILGGAIILAANVVIIVKQKSSS